MKKMIGIMAIALAFALAFAACDDGGGGGGGNSGLNGTWGDGAGETWVLNNGSFTASDGGDEFAKGTYSTSGSDITVTITQIKGAATGQYATQLGISPTQWYTRQQLRTAIMNFAVDVYGYSQSEAAETADEILDEIFVTLTGTYSGNTLTIDGDTYTRQGGSGDDGGGEGGGPGELTITGLPYSAWGWSVYVYPAGTSVSTIKAEGVEPEAQCIIPYGDYKEGDIVFDLDVLDQWEIWTGSGNRPVALTGGSDNTILFRLATVNFTNGSATVPFSRFTVVR